MKKIIIIADTKKDAYKLARKKRFIGDAKQIPVIPIKAIKHPKRRGQFIVSVRKDKRY